MGIAKQQMIEQEERGYGSIDKLVCVNCVGDYALKQFIVDNGGEDECDYCKSTNICIDVEELIGEIMDGIRFEYEEAVNCMSIDEGEFVGATTSDTYELLYDLYDEMQLNDDLLEDIKETINLTTWCEKDPYGLRKSQERTSMWNAFCRMVKTKTRYVFFRMPEHDVYQEESEFLILDHIGDEVGKLGLIEKLPPETNFFRGRMHDSEIIIREAKDLCSPPHNKAKSNRMSAEGISIFYGANDIKTAISEIYNSCYGYVTVASFQNIHELTILNLTKIREIEFPSLFDKKNRKDRESIIFLRDLDTNLTRPIESMESIEYIPAQIVAEYFRFLYTYKGNSIDGIAYRSSKVKNGICYALFFDHEQCLDNKPKNLFSSFHPQMIKMDKTILCTYKVSADIQLKKIKI